MTFLRSWLLVLAISCSLVSAHTVIVYPGWRRDNLKDMHYEADNGSYGMQWMYPCGGTGLSTNRTKWPVRGGAISIQPGWFSGHATAFFYINLGLGTEPLNMSNSMISNFQITGPSKDPYPGTFCLPQVPLPTNVTVNVGDNATIQVVEAALHGAALYNCVDITFAEPEDVAEVNSTNCFNSTELGFNSVYATAPESAAQMAFSIPSAYVALLPLLALGAVSLSL